jgi:hypothetical protein
MTSLGAQKTRKVVEEVPSLNVAAVRDSMGRRKKGTATITAIIDNTTFTARLHVIKDIHGRRWLRCPCGARRRYLYVQSGKVGCRKCLHLLYWEQTAIARNKWREEIGRPTLRAWRRARLSGQQGSGSQNRQTSF